MGKGVRSMGFPDVSGGESITGAVKKILKKERKKQTDQSGMGQLSEVMVFSTLSNSQNTLLSVLQTPPVTSSGVALKASDISSSSFGVNERAALIYAVNSSVKNAQSTYNAISALRAEVLLAFLDQGMNPHKGSKGGLFGGGVTGLLVISSFMGGSGLGSIFGGGSVTSTTTYGGLS